MTRYERGFLTKCAERGVPEHVARQMFKSAYELGSRSIRQNPPENGRGIRDDDYSFASEDPYSSLDLDPYGTGRVIAEATIPASPERAVFRRRFLNHNDHTPMSTKEQIKAYDAASKDEDGLIRRAPIVEDGQYNSTYVRDNMDLANLQSDAIRRRRGAGETLIWNPAIKRYRLPEQ